MNIDFKTLPIGSAKIYNKERLHYPFTCSHYTDANTLYKRYMRINVFVQIYTYNWYEI